MIVLNGLTKNGTCESVTAMSESGLIIISLSQDDHTKLKIINNISKQTDRSHMIGIIDTGTQYNFQAYNNRVKVTKHTNTVYRGIK